MTPEGVRQWPALEEVLHHGFGEVLALLRATAEEHHRRFEEVLSREEIIIKELANQRELFFSGQGRAPRTDVANSGSNFNIALAKRHTEAPTDDAETSRLSFSRPQEPYQDRDVRRAAMGRYSSFGMKSSGDEIVKTGVHSSDHFIYQRDAAYASLQRRWLSRTIMSPPCEMAIATVIVCNAVYIGLATQWRIDEVSGRHALDSSRVRTMQVLDFFFTAFYTVELLIKVVALRLKRIVFGRDKYWNFLDIGLVITGIYDLVGDATSGGRRSNILWLRLLRLVRFGKMLRVVRVMRMFKELRIILASIVAGLRSFFWVFLVLLMLKYVFGLIFVQGVTNFLHEEENMEPALREALLNDWGSIFDAMLTLYRPVSAGGPWGPTATRLRKVGFAYFLVFIVYLAFIIFALLKLLTGIFVQQAKEVSKFDRASLVHDRLAHMDKLTVEITGLFHYLDDDDSGKLSWDEFKGHLDDPLMRAYLANIELDVKDAERLFEFLAADGVSVDIGEFVKGCDRIRGSARSSDIMFLSADVLELRHLTTELLSCVANGVHKKEATCVEDTMPINSAAAMHKMEDMRGDDTMTNKMQSI